eukprot:TRINITY_DN7435_c0_g1_i1.p1 TRINITY_DN7435_c0_g1~~TRINITY_DN7435_c0_g1_i1.p1  ORF type:complete len:514 (+),score=62.26 TRINITY_DN7435_c0_g1_i1:19-1560(+)
MAMQSPAGMPTEVRVVEVTSAEPSEDARERRAESTPMHLRQPTLTQQPMPTPALLQPRFGNLKQAAWKPSLRTVETSLGLLDEGVPSKASEWAQPRSTLVEVWGLAEQREQREGFLAIELNELREVVGFMLGCHSRSQLQTVVDHLAEWSQFATLAFFLGGFYNFKSVKLQRLYLWSFVLSFSLCFVSCTYNLHLKTAPFYDMRTMVITAYFHVFGLHSWLFWRGFVRHPDCVRFVETFSVPLQHADGDCGTRQFERSASHLADQLKPLMFFIKGNSTQSSFTRGDKGFALSHAILMWLSIPQHVPTVLSSMGLFSVITKLHVLDAERTLDVIGDPSAQLVNVDHSKISMDAEVEVACTCLERCQLRLDHTCESVTWLWIHQIAYALVQLLFVSINLQKVDASNVWNWPKHTWMRLLHDIWHAGVGFVLVGSALLVPGSTTFHFQNIPRYCVKALRERGWSIQQVAPNCEYFKMVFVGFIIFDTPITSSLVRQFASAVAVLIGLYVSVSGEAG